MSSEAPAPGQRPRVLVCAYACNPTLGSESAVGWNWVLAIARHHETWVLTDPMHEPAISAWCRQAPELVAPLHFCYVPRPRWHYDYRQPFWRRAELSVLRPLVHLSYLWWQRAAAVTARNLLPTVRPKLIHQLTLVGFRFPGRLWRLGVPFVWGPIGGLENTPIRLLTALGWQGGLYFALRNLVNSMQRRWLPAPRRAARTAAAVIAATTGIARTLRALYQCESIVITEVTAPPATTVVRFRGKGEALRLAWSGLHIPRKGLPLLLRALAGAEIAGDWLLDIFGDGPQTHAWRRLAMRLGIADRCRWHGHLPHDQAVAALGKAHVFVITSLQDLTSTVLLEALSQGLPVVCPNHCGFPDVVTDTAGYCLPIDRSSAFIAALRETLRRLAADEDARRRLAMGALRRAADFSLEAKSAAVRQVYDRVLGRCQADVVPSVCPEP